MRTPPNRRQFLSATAAGGMLLAGRLGGPLLAGAGRPAGSKLPPVKIHKLYVGRGRSAWPKPEFDVRAEVAKFDKHLAKVERQLGDVEFVGGQVVGSPADAAKVVPELAKADAVLAIHLSLGTLHLLGQIVNAKRPTVVFSQPFSGHEWMYVPQWQKLGQKVVLLASSNYDDIAPMVALLRVPARLRQTRILLVGGAAGAAPARAARPGKVIEAHKAVDGKAAAAEAERWIREAKKVVEPSKAEILKSARMFLAMKRLMDEERAQAITIRCLGGIPIGTLGYPCLGFSRLLDMGLVGACEADMDSTLTMLVFRYAFGVPGFISDPLIDTAKNAVIHAHCTGPTKMDGPAGKQAPYLIRTHRDDNRGASLEVEMRLGQPITCAKLINLDSLLISTGKIIEITDFDDRGCRTQITTEVADARKMQDNWGCGILKGGMMELLHRVVVYGDHLQDAKHLGALMGIRVIEEG